MLCERCRRIPFRKYFENEPYASSETFELGTLLQVKGRSNCVFCQFIAEAAYDGRVTSYPPPTYFETRPVKVFWLSNSLRANVLPLGTEVVFTAGEYARGKRAAGRKVDHELVGTWLRSCQSRHGECPPAALDDREREPRRFRLIDVQDFCIVDGSMHVHYITLSYVWGQVRNWRLLRSNKTAVMEIGGLRRYWNQMPLTVKDAITFIKKMNERYLWVDSLCLVQDDPDDLMDGIRQMDSIYEQSVFTIIAASGLDATAGLPGVRKGSRELTQIMVDVAPGIEMMILHQMEAFLKPSQYNRRAWTFQEYFLSRRKIIFINNMVYFRCRRCSWAEEAENDLHTTGSKLDYETLLEAIQDPDCDTFDALSNIISYYSPRALTKQEDCLNAMAGICQRLSKRCKCHFHQGIPVSAFDLYLVFVGARSDLRRRANFPSYSWAGWIGSIFYDAFGKDKNDWLENSTWIVWFKRSPSGVVSPVWDVAANEAFLNASADDIGYRIRKSFPADRAPHINTFRTTPSWDLPRGTAVRSYPMLQFWTMAAFYTLAESKDYAGGHHNPFDLFDKHGRYCGFLSMNTHQDSWGLTEGELVLLSQSPFVTSSSSMEYESPSRARDPEVYTTDKIYWVMLLEWQDGVAERRGLGQIFQNALLESLTPGPVWKEIILG